MPVNGIDHVNIRTTDVAKSAQFYVDLFGFEYRQGEPIMGHRPNWLYDAGGQPIIHFRIMEPDAATTGPIDHVALKCQGVDEIVERLKARDVQFHMAKDIVPGVTQIILKDPHGVSLELNFANG
jgi:catechol 2,3-dioxygenase-like lactoylglutathione lyase family enzyme